MSNQSKSNPNETSIRKINGIEHTGRQAFGKWYPLDWAEIVAACREFVPHSQMRFCIGHLNGEEGQHFIDVLTKLADIWKGAATTRQTNGMGESAVAFMHFFGGSFDLYLTEKDVEAEQLQAYGYVRIGRNEGFEAGYVDLTEIQAEPIINVDFDFMPETIATLRKAGKIK